MTEDILLTRSLSKELGLDQNEEKKSDRQSKRCKSA